MKKLFLVLIAVIAVLAIIFWRQVQRARSIVTTAVEAPLVSLESYPIPLEKTTPLRGNPGAPLTIVAFVDLGDAASQAMYIKLARFVDAHLQEARLAWQDFPKQMLFSGDNVIAHKGAWCAGEQNKFWPFVDQTAALTRRPSEANLLAIAQALKLNTALWQRCLLATDPAAKISAGLALGNALGINKPPGLFINNKRINVSSDVDLEQMLANFIAK